MPASTAASRASVTERPLLLMLRETSTARGRARSRVFAAAATPAPTPPARTTASTQPVPRMMIPPCPWGDNTGSGREFMRRRRDSSNDAEVLELPRIVGVEIFREQVPAVAQRRPVAIGADNLAEIGPHDFHAALEIHVVGLDDTGASVFDGPHHTGEHGRCDLQARCIVVGDEPPRLLDRQLRAVPVGA